MSARSYDGARLASRQPQQTIGRGFNDPVHDAHATFRAVMTALAEPGRPRVTPSAPETPLQMSPAMLAIALALTDFETPVWTDAGPDAEGYIQFHTGAPPVCEPSRAAFALVTSIDTAPPLCEFAHGTLEFPDRSTTLVIDVLKIATDSGWTLTGPGIEIPRHLMVGPLPDSVQAFVEANHALFPCGVDFIFCLDSTIVGLPRSTRVKQAGS